MNVLLRADRNALLDLLTSGAHDERADAILHATNQKAGVSAQKGGRRPRETGGWACSFSGRMVTRPLFDVSPVRDRAQAVRI